jgi:hypothetical protein
MKYFMAHCLLIQSGTIANHGFYTKGVKKGKIMRKKVKGVEEALEVLETLCICWITTNRIENSLWEKGVAFFDRSYCRVAYYDEVHNMLSIH